MKSLCPSIIIPKLIFDNKKKKIIIFYVKNRLRICNLSH